MWRTYHRMHSFQSELDRILKITGSIMGNFGMLETKLKQGLIDPTADMLDMVRGPPL